MQQAKDKKRTIDLGWSRVVQIPLETKVKDVERIFFDLFFSILLNPENLSADDLYAKLQPTLAKDLFDI